MEHKLYTVNEVAEILGLHPKTVQRFIREEKLRAKKIGRAWKVHQTDLNNFTRTKSEIEPPNSNTGSTPPLADRLTVSAVIELKDTDSEETSRISNSLIAMLNCKDPSWGKARYDLLYQPETRGARFILYGTPKFISAIFEALEMLTQQE